LRSGFANQLNKAKAPSPNGITDTDLGYWQYQRDFAGRLKRLKLDSRTSSLALPAEGFVLL
jgi:hypothetical protein